MLRTMRWLARLIGPTLWTIRVILRFSLGVTWMVIHELIGGLFVWIKTIPDACDKIAAEWAEKTAEADISVMARPVYLIMYAITFIEIVLVSVILAHLLVFTIFGAILLLQ